MVLAILSIMALTYRKPVLPTCPVVNIHELQTEAPETLVEPIRDLFINDSSYLVARIRFNACGDWSS